MALVAKTHPLAGEGEVPLAALADDGFVLFPRELAPRLYDFMVALCRHAGFEPKVRTESFHTGWDTGVLADVSVVALVPQSVARDLPAGVVALGLSDPLEEVETAILWRGDDSSAVAAAFREVARTLFESER